MSSQLKGSAAFGKFRDAAITANIGNAVLHKISGRARQGTGAKTLVQSAALGNSFRQMKVRRGVSRKGAVFLQRRPKVFRGLLFQILLGFWLFAVPSGAVAQGTCQIIVLASSPQLERAKVFSDRFESSFGTEVRQSPNGAFAIILQAPAPENQQTLLAELKDAGTIPSDAFCSSGKGYGPAQYINPPPAGTGQEQDLWDRVSNLSVPSFNPLAASLVGLGLFWAALMLVLAKGRTQNPIKQREIMRSPAAENLYPIELKNVYAQPGQSFRAGETLVVFKRLNAASQKRIVAREDGQTVALRCAAGVRLDEPSDLIVVEHASAQMIQPRKTARWGMMAAITAVFAGLFGAVYALSDKPVPEMLGHLDTQSLAVHWILGVGAVLLGLWLVLKTSRWFLTKRRAAQDPQKPKSPSLFASFAMAALLLVVIWISDHGYRVADDIHWILLILGLSAAFGIIPFAVFFWRRYAARAKDPSSIPSGPVRTLVFDGAAVFLAVAILFLQAIEVAGGSSLLLPLNHNKSIKAAFTEVEADLATRLPGLFGPDANDRRRAAALLDRDRRNAQLAAERLARDREIVAQFNARQRRAQQARADMARLLEDAKKFWPAVTSRVRNSACAEHALYRQAAGVKVYLGTLERTADTFVKFKDCVRRYERRNSTDLVSRYNSIVRAYQAAANTALEPSQIDRLRLADAKMVSAILEQDVVTPYRQQATRYVERNMATAVANTKAKERNDKRRREMQLRLLRQSQRLQRELDQQLQNALNPNYFNPSRNRVGGNWTTGNPGTPLSEFEFEDENGNSVDQLACQVDCGGDSSSSASEIKKAEEALAASEQAYEEARTRIERAEQTAAETAAEKAKAEARAAEAELLAAQVKAEEELEAARQKAREEQAAAAAKAKEEARKKKAEEEAEEASRRKAEEEDDGCFPVTPSCIGNESDWKGDKRFVRLRNNCDGRVVLGYCARKADGSEGCEQTSLFPGKRQVSQVFNPDPSGFVKWRVVGSRKMTKDWVCTRGYSRWQSSMR